MLAQMFAERIVGLRLGEIVYDGPAAGLTAEVLTQIYGEEDWSSTIRKPDEGSEAEHLDKVVPLHPPQPHRDRMAGLGEHDHRGCCHRFAPLATAAADQARLAALDARYRRRGLSRARPRQHQCELGARMGRLAARRAVRHSVLSARFRQPLGRNR